MESNPMVHRYAWHDPKTGTSAIFNTDGSLTATGQAYAQIESRARPSMGDDEQGSTL